MAHAARNHRQLRSTIRFYKNHYIQAAAQICIYFYWGWYWDQVAEYAELILAQILFAYLFEMLLTWSRRNEYVLGFGPLPIILSTNLFLWFREDWFFLQFLLVAVGYLGKEFVRWTKNGRRVHIFNPSAFSLAVFSVVLITTGTTHLTWGPEIATTLFRPEHIYLEIFLLGLVVQALFGVTLVTLAAGASLWALSAIYLEITGVYYFGDSTIPIGIFIGLHLLVTDPSTSPKTKIGRTLFGALYGLAAFVLFGTLDAFGAPTFYDKLLAVPLLNLSLQVLDRTARSMTARSWTGTPIARYAVVAQENVVHMGVWTVVFGAMVFTGEVGSEHPGQQADFWEQACREGRRNACRSLLHLQTTYCADGSAQACNALGVLYAKGELIDRDPHLAVVHFQRACNLGLSAGCTNLQNARSWRLEEISRLTAACEENQAQSCAYLGFMYHRGDGVPRDEQRALELAQKACALGFEPACAIGAQPTSDLP